MKSIRLLPILVGILFVTSLSACTKPAPSAATETSTPVEVELGLYSGVPDPAWTLTAEEAGDLDVALATLPRVNGSAEAGGLGYHGFSIHKGGEATLVAFRGTVASPDSEPPYYLDDPDHTIERFLLETARPHLKPEELAQVVRTILPAQQAGKPPRVPNGWTSNESRNREFIVRYPKSWVWARSTLTPHLGDPTEIFSVGTYPLRPGGSCAQFPTNAISDLGRGDVLVSVQERSSPDAIDTTAARLHPTFFRRMSRREQGPDESGACLDEPKDFSHWWIPFTAYGRDFYAYVAAGDLATKRKLREAWGILGNIIPEYSP